MEAELASKKLLTLRKPNSFFIWVGAFISSAMPMIPAGIMLWPYINYIKWGCKSSSASGRCLQYWPDRNEPQLWEFPIGFTCLILTPVVCVICCRYVIRMCHENSLEFNLFAKFTVKTALKIQIFAGIIYLMYLGVLDWEGVFVGLVYTFFASIAHVFVAVIITVPLSLICVLVFRIISLQKFKHP